MAKENFVQKTLDALFEVVEVEFKVPLGFAEIKLPVTDHAKKWWKNKKNRLELEKAIQRAEEKFIETNKDQKVAQMLHELPLYSEKEFKQVITRLLTHLNEEEIIWLAEVNLKNTWGNVASVEEIRKALELYIPFLRHELNSIKEFREVISALILERIDKRTERIEQIDEQTYASVRRIETNLEKILESREKIKEENQPDFWYFPHTYGMQANFTGRKAELKMLNDWLADDKSRLLVLRALGGFGKSALAWQWVNIHVNPQEYPKLIWWSFYESDASFDNFLTDTLKYLNVEIPQGQRNQVDEILKATQSQKILFVLDGFERILRAYSSTNASYQGLEEPKREANDSDCVNSNAEILLRNICMTPGIKSKALMTTRMTPRFLEPQPEQFIQGCVETELNAINEDDAIAFLRAQGVQQGTNREINEACKTYGYHPLSLRLLAGRIVNDFDDPGDIIVAQRIKIDGDLIQRQSHVLKVSYDILPANEQKLLSTIACFRSAITHETLKAIAENKDDLDNELHDLVERGLLFHDKRTKKFDLHPIVRHYAYQRLPTSDCIFIHNTLIDYFASLNIPNQITNLEDISSLIELCYHLAKAVRIDEAASIYTNYLHNPIYLQFNSYQLGVELLTNMFTNGEGRLPPAKRYDLQVSILNRLGMLYGRLGQPSKSIFLREASIALILQTVETKNLYLRLGQLGRSFLSDEELNRLTDKTSDRFTLSSLYSNLAEQELSIGKLKSAEENMRSSRSLVEETNAYYLRSSTLGHILSYCGMWSESEQEFAIAGEWLEKAEQEFATSASQEDKDASYQLQALNWTYISFYFLLKCREDFNSYNLKSAVNSAFRALELAHKDKKPVPHDLMFIHYLLGTTIHAGGNLVEAEKNLNEAVRICRSINAIDREADILLALARLSFAYALRSAPGSAQDELFKDAQEKASEALVITERCGYVLQGADVNLFLAELTLTLDPSPEGRGKARQYAETALKLAACDGPPYYYKVAYEEAEAMLKRLNV